MKNQKDKIRKLTLTAIFTAIAYLTVYIFPIRVGFLTLDFKDAVMTVGALYLGVGAGIAMSALTALIELVTVSSTGYYGFIMNFLGSAAFAVTAALIYRRNKRLENAILGLSSATAAMTVVMLGLNLCITPLYGGVTLAAVVEMLPALLVFNLLKGLVNSAIAMLLYKPVAKAIRSTHLSLDASNNTKKNKYSLAVTIASVCIIAACLLVMFLMMDASFSLILEL